MSNHCSKSMIFRAAVLVWRFWLNSHLAAGKEMGEEGGWGWWGVGSKRVEGSGSGFAGGPFFCVSSPVFFPRRRSTRRICTPAPWLRIAPPCCCSCAARSCWKPSSATPRRTLVVRSRQLGHQGSYFLQAGRAFDPWHFIGSSDRPKES